MIRRLSEYISNVFLKSNSIDTSQYENSIFGLEVIFISIFQITGLIITGIILHKLDKLLFFFLPFMILRTSAGGIHASSAFRCFVYSVASFLTALLLEYLFYPFKYFIYINLFVAFILIFRYAPQDSINKPFKRNEKQKFRVMSLLISITLISIIIFIYKFYQYRSFSILASVGVLFESITLLPVLAGSKVII